MGPRAPTAAFEAASRRVFSMEAGLAAAHAHRAYRLDERVGSGSVAEVWRAVGSDDCTVALKLLRQELAGRRNAEALLDRELSVLERVSHPSIVSAGGMVAGNRLMPNPPRAARAIVLEWLGGGDLVSVAGAHAKHWIDAAIDIAAAIEHLHGFGIVHGDVKARNVLFDAGGRARLVDFSCAKPIGSRLRQAIGTATQQRPRLTGHRVSEDDDIFAFAALLHELLHGHPPFVKGSVSRLSKLSTSREWWSGVDSSGATDELASNISNLLGASVRTRSSEIGKIRGWLRAVRAQ